MRAAGEVRVELVNSGIEQRLRAAGIPVHGVDHDTVIDPGAVVPGKKRVWQRRQYKAVVPDVTAEQPRRLKWQLFYRQATEQVRRQQLARNLCHPAGQLRFRPHAYLVCGNSVIEHPAARLGMIEGFCQQGVDVQHLHPFVAHRLGKDVVILLSLLYPKHIIKQQLLAVTRGQATVRQTRPADYYLTQTPRFRMHTKLLYRHIHFSLFHW